MVKEISITPRNLSHVLKDYLHVRESEQCPGQILTPRLQALRIERAMNLQKFEGFSVVITLRL